jgi:hypothetical protein
MGDYLNLDWNLPVAASVGIEPDQLASLSDDELRLLHQPYIYIINSIILEYGVNIIIGTLDCDFVTRDDVIYTITNISLAEIELSFRELAIEVRNVEYSSRIIEAILDSGYSDTLALYDVALDYVAFDPVEAYYRIQQSGVSFFYDKIEHFYEEIEPFATGPIRHFRFVADTPLPERFWRNSMNANFCMAQFVFTRITSTPVLTPNHPWTTHTPGRNVSVRIDAGRPNQVTSRDYTGVLQATINGIPTRIWWDTPINTFFRMEHIAGELG